MFFFTFCLREVFRLRRFFRNFALEKKTTEINIVSAEVQPTLGLAKVYYYEELNCNNIGLDWNLERIIDNFNTLSVMIYQEFTTDIRGNPN